MAGKRSPWGGGLTAATTARRRRRAARRRRVRWRPPPEAGKRDTPARPAQSLASRRRTRTAAAARPASRTSSASAAPKARAARGGGPAARPISGCRGRPAAASWFPLIIATVVGLWLAFSMFHQLGPKEEGIVTTFGKYSRTIKLGHLDVTLPWPIQDVDVEQVSEIRIFQFPRRRSREADAHRRPEPGQPLLHRALEHQGPEAIPVSSSRSRKTRSGSGRSGDARFGGRATARPACSPAPAAATSKRACASGCRTCSMPIARAC